MKEPMVTIELSKSTYDLLKKLARPFVDTTPEKVIRRMLDAQEASLGTVTEQEPESDEQVPSPPEQSTEPVHKSVSEYIDIWIPSGDGYERRYHLIPIPTGHRSFFPGYKVPFIIETDLGPVESWVTSAP